MRKTHRDPISMLEYEASRNPVLADLVDRAGLLTDSEIDQAPVKLPWMRKALRELRTQKEYDALICASQEWVRVGQTSNPVGEMREWVGSDQFIPLRRGHLQIQHGQLVWFDGTGAWIDSIYLPSVDPMLWQQTVPKGKVKRSEYIDAVRDRARGQIPTVPSEQRPLYQFYRP